MRRLKVGVIGLGVGSQHLAGFEADARCEVVAVCDLDPQRLKEATRDKPELAATTEAEELIGRSELDIVSIASYDDAHFAQASAALENGKNVFVEKPLCRTADEVRALAHALQERPHLVLASNLVLRAAPLYRFTREQVATGAFGNVYAFDGDYLYGRLHKITEGWRGQVENYSVMLGGGVHLVDLMLWITQERPTRVAAVGNRISTSDTPFRYDDFVAAGFEFPSGLVGRITANFASVHAHQHVVRVFGTNATLLYDDCGARVHRSRDPDEATERLELAALPASKAELIPEFVERVVGGGADKGQTRHELDVVSACIAADRALAEGGAVDIEYA
jgi:predicted dehydrogenase